MNNGCRLSPLALGLSLGIIWALSVVLMAILSWTLGYGAGFVTAVGSVYVGYTETFIGILIGAGFAFLDGLIGGLLIGFFYNIFARCTCCSKKSEQK